MELDEWQQNPIAVDKLFYFREPEVFGVTDISKLM